VVRPNVRHLGYVKQSFDACVQTDECAKISDPCNDRLNEFGGLVVLLYLTPWVRLYSLETQANSLALLIDAQHLDVNPLAYSQNLTGMSDGEPGDLGDVNQALCAAQVYKRAEVGQAAHRARAHFTYLDFVE